MITFTELELVLISAVVVLLWAYRTAREESERHKFAAETLMSAVKAVAEKQCEIIKDKNGEFRLINLQEQRA